MNFGAPLIPGRLIQRYKRFLADVELEDGRKVTAHCANPGAMTGMADPGMTVWLEPNDDPRKKLKFAWKIVETSTGPVGVDTGLPNRVVEEALRADAIAAFAGYDDLRREVKYGQGSRIDFLLTGAGRPDCYLEVKCVTLRRGAFAEFPDTKTARGAKHLVELAEVAASGARAATLYLAHRADCADMRIAADIDPAYAAAHADAASAGMETHAFAADVTLTGVALGPEMTFHPRDTA